ELDESWKCHLCVPHGCKYRYTCSTVPLTTVTSTRSMSPADAPEAAHPAVLPVALVPVVISGLLPPVVTDVPFTRMSTCTVPPAGDMTISQPDHGPTSAGRNCCQPSPTCRPASLMTAADRAPVPPPPGNVPRSVRFGPSGSSKTCSSPLTSSMLSDGCAVSF